MVERNYHKLVEWHSSGDRNWYVVRYLLAISDKRLSWPQTPFRSSFTMLWTIFFFVAVFTKSDHKGGVERKPHHKVIQTQFGLALTKKSSKTMMNHNFSCFLASLFFVYRESKLLRECGKTSNAMKLTVVLWLIFSKRNNEEKLSFALNTSTPDDGAARDWLVAVDCWTLKVWNNRSRTQQSSAACCGALPPTNSTFALINGRERKVLASTFWPFDKLCNCSRLLIDGAPHERYEPNLTTSSLMKSRDQ